MGTLTEVMIWIWFIAWVLHGWVMETRASEMIEAAKARRRAEGDDAARKGEDDQE